MEITVNNYKKVLDTYRNAHQRLPIDTIIKFPVDGQTYIYLVKNTYLHSKDTGHNDSIFILLGLNKYSFCRAIYDCDPGQGSFPEYWGHGSGMIDVIEALFDECVIHKKPLKVLKITPILKSSILI